MIISNNQDIGIAISKGRQEKNWSQQELADLLGVHRTWVIKAEKGELHMDSTKLLNALDLVGYELEVHRAPEPDETDIEELFYKEYYGEE